jgi:superfamily II RNA helicase
MTAPPPLFACLPPGDARTPDGILAAFLDYVEAKDLVLYPHQEEAILAALAHQNVIVHTPTGSGKSLIATAVHFRALAEGKRCFYTSPIKALVSEKFFDLCRELGPDQVGMMTGDATVNRDAAIICCTAEVLANIALAGGAEADVDLVVMDEFHYFADKERGVAWQVPLLTLPQARFILMSATLGDVSVFERALERLTATPVTTVRTADRPVPLTFHYENLALHEAIVLLTERGQAPVYVVGFTQRAAAESAQSLLSIDFCSKEHKRRIADALAGESFRSPYGKEIQKLLRHGVGIHHAGLLPRYRLLVEKLAQQGLLQVICGTDTLGVGVNVPIRTVLLTRLCKYDGTKMRILSAREFHQIAGRAGRRGFDDHGYVVALAPEHVVENLRLEAKAKSGKGNKKKFVRKKPPDFGYAHYDGQTFERLVAAPPEPLVSHFQVSQGMLLQVLGRPRGGCRAMKDLVRDCLDTPHQKARHKRHALELLRSLWMAGVIHFRKAADGGGLTLSDDLQDDFSLFHALGLYVVDAVERLDRESEDYALDVLSLVEAIVEDPEVVLRQQIDKLKREKLAELKAAGVEYDARMEELDKITHPKPNLEFLEVSFALFAQDHPWVAREVLRPKSVAREMAESLESFGGYVKHYGLQRSEGLLLRYLSDVFKTLVQTVPEGARTSALEDVMDYLGALVRGVDASLLDEWQRLRDPTYLPALAPDEAAPPAPTDLDPRKLRNLVQNLLASMLRAIDADDAESALDLVEPGEKVISPAELGRAFAPARAEGGLRLDAQGRSPTLTRIEPIDAGFWQVTRNIMIGDEISEYTLVGRVDLERSARERRAVLLLDHAGAEG